MKIQIFFNHQQRMTTNLEPSAAYTKNNCMSIHFVMKLKYAM